MSQPPPDSNSSNVSPSQNPQNSTSDAPNLPPQFRTPSPPNCAICQEPLSAPSALLMPCNHEFDLDCVVSLQSRPPFAWKCPMCRRDLTAIRYTSSSGIPSTHSREYRMDKTRLDPEICSLVENSKNYTLKDRAQALDRYARMRHIFDEIASKYSAILAPGAVDEAPIGLQDMGSAVFNFFWTGIHMPAINIPFFIGSHGMPVGISVLAGRLFDQHLPKIGKVLSEPLMAEGGWKIEDSSEPG